MLKHKKRFLSKRLQKDKTRKPHIQKKCKTICKNTNRKHNKTLKGGFYIGGNPETSIIGSDCTQRLPPISKENIDDLLTSNRILGYVPLFKLPDFLKECGINEYALLDYNNNHIYFHPLIINDDKQIRIVKILPSLQIQISPTILIKSEYLREYGENIYDFKRFCTEMCQYSSPDGLGLYANMYYKYYDIYLYNILVNNGKTYNYKVDETINQYIYQNNYEIQRTVAIPELEKLLLEFVRPNMPGGVLTTIEFHNNMNIVKLFTFINDIYMLYKIIDIDYYNYRDYFAISKRGVETIDISDIANLDLGSENFKNTIEFLDLNKVLKIALSSKANHVDNFISTLKNESINAKVNYEHILNLDYYDKQLYDEIDRLQEQKINVDVMMNNKLFYKAVRILRGLLKNSDNTIDIAKTDLIVNTYNWVSGIYYFLFLDFLNKNAARKKMQNNPPIKDYFFGILNKIKNIYPLYPTLEFIK